MRSAEFKRTTRVVGALFVLLAAFLACPPGKSVAQSAGGQQTKSACVRAGMVHPSGLLLRFHLQIDSHSTGPWPVLDYYVPPMPGECNGYKRTFFLQVRYKTTLRGWRTFRGYSLNVPHGKHPINVRPGVWMPVENLNEGTGFKTGSEMGSLEFTKAPWGYVEKVKARGRLWVEDRASGRLLAHDTFPIKSRFCRAPKVSAPRWCR
jgi:hypothetical protein